MEGFLKILGGTGLVLGAFAYCGELYFFSYYRLWAIFFAEHRINTLLQAVYLPTEYTGADVL